MDFEIICRLCLKPNKLTYDIFTNFCLKRNYLYSEMLSSCTKLKPQRDDNLPKQICKECSRQLKKTYSFNQMCETSDDTLRQYFKSLDSVKLEESVLDESCDVKEDREKLLSNDIENLVECKDEIKLEFDYNNGDNEEAVDDWDPDDNMLLGDIKLNKELTTEDVMKPAKKRGRKKKVYMNDGSDRVLSKSPHQCDICGKFLSTKSNLNAHKICHTDLRPYKCSECPASFRGHSALFQHKTLHSGETPYHCEYCPKRFRRKTGLINHIRLHTGEKRYNCDICFKAFVQSAQLSIHMKRHKGDKPFLCQDCGKGFPVKADLKVHQRVHNGEKPYPCHLCTKTFATAGNLAIHIRIHNKEVRYNCKECNRGFVAHSAYSIHVKRHSGQKDYRCDCGKTFYTSSALKQHKVVHTGEKKYQCRICERKFSQSSHLNRHFKRDHLKTNAAVPPSSQYKVVLTGNSVCLTTVVADKDHVKCEDRQMLLGAS